jgi:4-hydroxyphenylacetate 3-monooxygenase oxygenase component
VKTGKDYANSLNDSRSVYINGKKVQDVREDPNFSGIVKTISALYDLAFEAEYRELLTARDENTGEDILTAFTFPRAQNDLRRMRNFFQIWASSSVGLLGRSPDVVWLLLLGIYNMKTQLAGFNPDFARNIEEYWNHCKTTSPCLSHAFLTPQVDRSKGRRQNNDLAVVDENINGIVLSGGRQLATLAPVSEELLIYPWFPADDEDEFASVFVVPTNSEGLKIICREGYAKDRSQFDHPLASTYDEGDAFLSFDHVLVPWNRVFLTGKGAAKYARNQILPKLTGWTNWQAEIRKVEKMKFFVGLACFIAECIAIDQIPHVQEKIGEMIAWTNIIEGCIYGAEAEAFTDSTGVLIPNERILRAARTLDGEKIWPRFAEIVRTISGAGIVMTPSEEDFDNKETAPIVDKYFRTSKFSAKERTRIFRLAWDAVGENFGSRQLHYEYYHGGDPIRIKSSFFTSEDLEPYKKLVRNQLSKM